MQNNMIRAQNGETVQLNPNQTAQYEEPPIRVETTVYGTPNRHNPDTYDDFTVETKMWMPDGQVYTNNQPINQGHNQMNPPLQGATPAPLTNPAGYVSPSRVARQPEYISPSRNVASYAPQPTYNHVPESY